MQAYKLLILEQGRPVEERQVEAVSENAAVRACADAVEEELVPAPGGDKIIKGEWQRSPTRIGIQWFSKTLKSSTWRWVVAPRELDVNGKMKRIAGTREEVVAHNEHVKECGRRRRAGLILRDAYDNRQAVKAAGGIWDSFAKTWLLPNKKAVRKLGARPANGKHGPHWTMKPKEEKR